MNQLIRSIPNKVSKNVVLLNRSVSVSSFNRSYSTTINNNKKGGEAKNLGYLKNEELDCEILEKEREGNLLFDAIDEFEMHGMYESERISTEETIEEEIKIDSKKIEINDQQAPYYHASKQAEKSLRTHLNRFFLKVHPDIFFNNDLHRSINQKSLAKLNNLLRTLEDYIAVSEEKSDSTKLDKIPTQISFQFMVEFDEDGRIGEINQDFSFLDAPESILTSKSSLLQYTTELRFSVYRQIFTLLEKAGISIPKSDKEMLRNPEPVPRELYDDPWEEYFAEDPSNLTLSGQLEAYIAEFPVTEERMIAEFTPEHQRLMDQFQENRVFFYFGENAKGDLDYMRQLNLREESEYQIVHLKQNLMALEYQDWNSLPIIIVDRQYYNIMEPALSAKGFVVLEKDFDPVTTLAYIKEVVIPKTTKTFKSIFTTATNNRGILEEKTIKLENLLGSSSVVVENLFSVNQKTLDRVRESFNQSLTLIGELKIPAIQLLDAVKAESWKKLPNTNFNDTEFQQWKINNVVTNTQEKLEYIASREKNFVDRKRVPLLESQLEQLERINSTMNKITSHQATGSDTRDAPLTIVDKNQFDSIQSTPFLNTSLSAIERLTQLFEKPTRVPFLLSEKPVEHPLAALKSKASAMDSDDFENGVFVEDIDSDLIYGREEEKYEDELENFDLLDDESKLSAAATTGATTGAPLDFESALSGNTTVAGVTSSTDSTTLSKEELKELQEHFSLNNVIPIETVAKIDPTYVAKINFMTTGNNFDNTAPIPINGPAESGVGVSSTNSATGELDINSILSDAKSSNNGISSDLDDFFSKLSNLDAPTATTAVVQPEESLFDQLQKLQYNSNSAAEADLKAKESLESIQMIEQRLSDFKWDKINLIISDRYQFIVTHDHKAGFCFIPSNFDEKELFIFLNSVQDSFDLINGGANKAHEEYTIKSLLAVENSVNRLQHLYKFKSVLIDNQVVPSKLSQYSFINQFTDTMQSEQVSPVENVTLKNISQYVTLVVSDHYSIQYLNNQTGKPINDNDSNAIFDSKHALIKVDSNNFNMNIFLQYVFVTLSETSEFFNSIITKTYQLPSKPSIPTLDQVKQSINQQYGFDRIKTSEVLDELDFVANKNNFKLEDHDEFEIDEFDNEEPTTTTTTTTTKTTAENNSDSSNVYSASSFLSDIQKVSEDIDQNKKN